MMRYAHQECGENAGLAAIGDSRAIGQCEICGSHGQRLHLFGLLGECSVLELLETRHRQLDELVKELRFSDAMVAASDAIGLIVMLMKEQRP